MNNIPAVPALQQYLDERGLTVHKWALEKGLDPSKLSKILRGLQKTVTFETALKIELATDGVVAVDMWVPQ